MGDLEDFPPWNNSRQRMYSKDQRPVLNYDPIKLAKKERESSRDDQNLPKYSRLKREW